MKPSDITTPDPQLVTSVSNSILIDPQFKDMVRLRYKITVVINIHINKYLKSLEPHSYSVHYDTRHALTSADKQPLIDAVISEYKLKELDNIL